MKIDLEKHDLGHPCPNPEHHVLGLTWRCVKGGKCVCCVKARSAVWYAANRDKAKALSTAWHAANRDKEKARKAAWQAANRDKEKARKAARYAANPDKAKARDAAWRAANPDKVNANRAKRRASQMQRTPAWADLKDIAEFYKTARWLLLHVDHIVPLQGRKVSGLHVSNNLRLITPAENSRKRNNFDPWTHVHEVPAEALEWLAALKAETAQNLLSDAAR